MKKVNFFKLMTACMAFAAVTFTSCSEEDMSIVTPGNTVIPGMPESPVIPATASVAISVYDVTTNILLGVTSVDATANIGKTMEVECPAYDKYIVAPKVTVAIPELKDGQSAVVPVVFYVASEGTAEAAILAQLSEENQIEVEEIELIKAETTEIANDKKLIMEVKAEKLTYYVGMQYVGETTKPASKAVASGYEFIESILKEIAFEKKELTTLAFKMNPYHQTETTFEQAGSTIAYKIEFNGTEYYAEFQKAGIAKWTMAAHTVIPEYEHDWAHLHTHGHAGHDWLHGDNMNAGGGITSAE